VEKKKQILQRIQDNVLEYAQEDSQGREFLTDEGFHSLTSTIIQTLCGVICLQAIMNNMDRDKFSVMVDKMTTIIKTMCHSYHDRKLREEK
jgi:3-methyladenine DNA glycosylase/8-oxoguanine DNA glycosylase